MDIDGFLGGEFLKDNDTDDDGEEEEDQFSDSDSDSVFEQEDEKEEDSDAEVEAHQRELDELAKKDPEFFEHLQKEGGQLLDFQAKTEKIVQEQEEEEEEMEEEQEEEDGKIEVTDEICDKILQDALVRHSKKGVSTLVQAFRAGVYSAGSLGEEQKSTKKQSAQKFKFSIPDSEVLDKIMTKSIEGLSTTFSSLLALKPDSKALPNRSKNFTRFESVIKGFLKSYTYLLQTATDPAMLRFLLQSLRDYEPYFACFPSNVGKIHLRALIQLWATHTDGGVRLTAFLRIRQLVLKARDPLLGIALREMYLEFVKNAKFSNAYVAERVGMQAHCLVEIFGLDMDASYVFFFFAFFLKLLIIKKNRYELGFIYIRQLALHLRKSITSTTEEALKQVYCWKYIHCLRVWGAILSSHVELEALIYPLTQITLGVIKLIPTSRHFPLHLHCIDLLVKLDRRTGKYIPLGFPLLDILESTPELFKPAVANTNKPPDLDHILKVKKEELFYSTTREVLVSRVLKLLKLHLEAHQFDISFPEFFVPISMGLSQFSRKCRVSRWRAQIKALIKQCDSWADSIKSQRNSFGPRDSVKLNAFQVEARRKLAEALGMDEQQDIQELASLISDNNNNEYTFKNKNSNIEEDEPDSDDEDRIDDDDDVEKVPTKKRRKNRRKERKVFQDDGKDSDAEDEVKDLQLSSSDEDSD